MGLQGRGGWGKGEGRGWGRGKEEREGLSAQQVLPEVQFSSSNSKMAPLQTDFQRECCRHGDMPAKHTSQLDKAACFSAVWCITTLLWLNSNRALRRWNFLTDQKEFVRVKQ